MTRNARSVDEHGRDLANQVAPLREVELDPGILRRGQPVVHVLSPTPPRDGEASARQLDRRLDGIKSLREARLHKNARVAVRRGTYPREMREEATDRPREHRVVVRVHLPVARPLLPERRRARRPHEAEAGEVLARHRRQPLVPEPMVHQHVAEVARPVDASADMPAVRPNQPLAQIRDHRRNVALGHEPERQRQNVAHLAPRAEDVRLRVVMLPEERRVGLPPKVREARRVRPRALHLREMRHRAVGLDQERRVDERGVEEVPARRRAPVAEALLPESVRRPRREGLRRALQLRVLTHGEVGRREVGEEAPRQRDRVARPVGIVVVADPRVDRALVPRRVVQPLRVERADVVDLEGRVLVRLRVHEARRALVTDAAVARIADEVRAHRPPRRVPEPV